MNWLPIWLDNPIFVKHARSKLRPMQLVPSLAVVMIIALGIVLMGYQYDKFRSGITFGGLMALQAIILGIVGGAQVGGSVSKARESGIFEFHRVSPMSPPSVTMGFFFGGPVREYLMFAATLPFSLVCVMAGRPSAPGFVQLMVPLVLGAWTLHALALLNALLWKPSKSGAKALVGIVLFVIFFSGGLAAGFARAAVTVDESPTLMFYSMEFPWLVVLALNLLPAIGFLLLASARKIGSERALPYSKPEAVACLATAQFLLLGDLWDIPWFGYWALGILYASMVMAMVLAGTMTPNLGEYTKGVRKAVRAGGRHPSAWSDRGLNRPALFCLCAIVLVGPTLAWRAIEEPAPWASQRGNPSYSLPIAIGVFAVAYFGLALQYFQVRFGKRGPTFLALFLFAAWVLPVVVGVIAAAGSNGPGSGQSVVGAVIASLSPVAGITLSAGMADSLPLQSIRLAAIMPAIGFAFLFNGLVIRARRRIDLLVNPDLFKPDSDPLAEKMPAAAEVA